MANNYNFKHSIFQWNINGFYQQKESLQLLINTHNPIVIGLQETNFKNNCYSPINNFSVFYKNRINPHHASGGVATYIHKQYKAFEIQLNSNIEAIAVSILLPMGFITICNIYLPNHYKFSFSELHDLIRQLPKPFLIIGDFNSHSYTWGSSKNDLRGKIIEKVLEDDDFILLNHKKSTHFNNSYNSLSAIDLSICHTTISHLFEWAISNELHGSDHFPIFINLQKTSSTAPDIPLHRKWIFHKADWEKYKEIILHKINFLNSSNSLKLPLNQKVEDFTNIILDAANSSIPKSSGIPRKRLVPWWNHECQRSLTAYKHSFCCFKRHPTFENQIEYKRLRSAARWTFKSSKKKSWYDFVSSMNASTPVSEAWIKIKRIKGINRQPCATVLFDSNNVVISDPKEISNEFARSFAKNSSHDNYERDFIQFAERFGTSIDDILKLNTHSNPVINSNINEDDVTRMLKKCNNSSPGPDGIYYVFLKNLPSNATLFLTKLYNEILSSGTFPNKWSEAIVIPVPKPGKDHSLADNYRPIALTSTLCKLMEKVVNERLVWFLDNLNFLSPFQSGFRKHRSTIDHLVNIESNICDAFVMKQHLVAVGLDIEKAYEMVWRGRIIKVLSDIGVNGKCLVFIANFLKNRSIRVKYANTLSDTFFVENGVPQGSVLAVTLFLVAINEIASIIPRPIRIFIFADDVIILCSGTCLKTTETLLQDALHRLLNWSNKAGFKFSRNKTEYIIFSKINNPGKIRLLYGHHKLKRTDQMKILGLTFDSKLTWKLHIINLKATCAQRLNVIKSISSTNWGADRDIILTTYRALIRSRLDYGAVIYDSAKPHVINMLNSIHSAGIRMAIGAYRSSPILSILAEANEEPLWIRRRKLCFTYAAKLSHSVNNPVKDNIFSNRYDDVYNSKKSYPKPLYRRLNAYFNDISFTMPKNLFQQFQWDPPWLISVPNIDMSLIKHNKHTTNPLTYRQLYNELRADYKDYIEIYTDGSHSEEGSGCAIVWENSPTKFKLENICSVFYCEAFAVYQALIKIRKSNELKFVVFTDSLSLIQCFMSIQNNKEPIIHKIFKLHQDIKTDNKVVIFIWIPSHVGIEGNEMADSAAKEARFLSTSGIFPVSHTDLKKELHKKNTDLWNTVWTRSPPQKLAAIRQNIHDKPFYPTNRKEQVTITRLRIGHSQLSHTHLFTKLPPNKCNHCSVPVTILHVIIECPVFQNLRNLRNVKCNLKECFSSKTDTVNTLKFIKDVNLLNSI